MKILKISLAVIALLVIIFFGNGLLKPTISYQNEITINEASENVWMVMADESKMGDWLPGYLRTEHISGIPGTVGSVSHIYFEENGEEVMMVETITEFVPNKRMAMNFSMDFMTMEYEMTTEENNGQTTIISKSKTEGNGLFAQSILSFMKSAMHSQEEENLGNLKALVEGE